MNKPNLVTIRDLQQFLRDLHPDYVAEFGAEAVDDAIAGAVRPARYEQLTRDQIDELWDFAEDSLLLNHPDQHGEREPWFPATGEVGTIGLDRDQPRDQSRAL